MFTRKKTKGGMAKLIAFAGAASVLTLMAVGVAEPAQALDEPAPLINYTFADAANGVISDVSGNGNDGQIKGEGISVEDGELRLPGGNWNGGNGAYVEVPSADLVGKDSLTVSIWLKNEMGAGNYAAASIGNVQVNKGYWLLNPSNLQGVIKSVVTQATTDNPSGTPYYTEVGSGGTNDPTNGHKSTSSMAMYTTVIDKASGHTSFYFNGEKVSEVETAAGIGDYGSSEKDLKAYLGRSSYSDVFFKGLIGKYEVYGEGLRDSAVASLYAAQAPAFAFKQLDVPREAESGFKLVSQAAGLDVTWDIVEGHEFAGFGENGFVNITRPLHGDEAGRVVLRATILGVTKDFVVLIPAETTSWEEQVKLAASRLEIHNADSMKENFSLPLTGDNGTSISWTIVGDSAGASIGDGQTEDSKTVTIERPATGADAVSFLLRAEVTKGEVSASRDISITVPPLPEQLDQTEAYVWAYFTGEGQGGEKISLAASQGNDALAWNSLNDQAPLISSTEGTKGLRDPFIMRSKDGDRYYLIATDLKIDGLQGGFATAQFAGSKYIEIWESEDLVQWSNQRHVKVSSEYAGNTWAPEAYYDKDNEQYIVYWASNLFDTTDPGDRTAPSYNRMIYVTTTDFVTFSEPQIWVDVDRRGQAGAGTIDVTMERTDDGMWHRFIKDEKTMMIRHEKSSDPYAKVTGSLPTASETDGWVLVQDNVGKGIVNGLGGSGQGEGPNIFRANEGDINGYEWYLFIDQPNYHGGPNHYVPFGTADLNHPDWVGELSKLQSAIPTLADGGHPRHGTVMPITRSEYQTLLKGLQPDIAVQSVDPMTINTVVGAIPVLPKATLHMEDGSEKNVVVKWADIDPSDYAQAGTFTVKGVAQDESRMPVEATVIVVESLASSADLASLRVAGNDVDLQDDILNVVVERISDLSVSQVQAVTVDAGAKAEVTIDKTQGKIAVEVTSKDGTAAQTYVVQLIAPTAHYDMSFEAGKLVDVSDNTYDAALEGITELNFASYGNSGVLAFSKDGYAILPQGAITADTNDFTVEMTVNAYHCADHFAWVLGDGVGAWNTTALGNHIFLNPNSAQNGYKGDIMGAVRVKDSGNGEVRMPSAGKAGQGFSTVTMVSQGDTMTIYVDGVQRSQLTHNKSLKDIIKGDTLGYIGRSLYTGDPLFTGFVSDVKLYNRALTATNVAASMPSAESKRELSWSVIEAEIERVLLGENASKNDITDDLNFAADIYGWPLQWSSSNEDVITAEGKLGVVSRNETVTITVSDGYGHSKVFDVEVRFTSDEQKAIADLDAISLQERAVENLPLVSVGQSNGSHITWVSSNENLVSSTDTGYVAPAVGAADPYQGAGIISRPLYGEGDSQPVTLTATATYGDATAERTWDVVVAEKSRWAPDAGYASAYFKSDNDEKIYEAATTANDFFTFKEVNDGKPVIDNTAAGIDTGGLRDPYILRSHDGDKYYMIATDLKIGGNGGNWGPAQSEGSLKVEVWESTDMVTWTPTNGKEPGITINQPAAGMTWAPEAYWDDDLDAYVVFFASRIYKDEAHTDTDWYARMFYVITRDFVTFTYPPATWQDTGYARIDSTVMKIDGYYYRFTKNEEGNGADGLERGKDIFVEKSKVLTAPTFRSDWDADPNETWQLVDTAMTTPKTGNAGEGPEIVKLNQGDPNNTSDDDGFVFLVDNYSAGGYVPFVTTGKELASSGLGDRISLRDTWEPGAKSGLPVSPRHGAFVNASQTVLEAMHTWSGIKAVSSEIRASVEGREVSVSVLAADQGDVVGTVLVSVGDWSQRVPVSSVGGASHPTVSIPWSVAGQLKVEYFPYDGLVEPATYFGQEIEAGLVVVPPAPTFDNSICGIEPTLTLPEVAGVQYSLDKEGTVWRVDAQPSDGYYFEGESQSVSWLFDGSITECKPGVGGEVTPVEPAAPTLIPAQTCGQQATVDIPVIVGVVYSVDKDGNVVTVKAVADQGYVLKGGIDSAEWVFDISAKECPPDPGLEAGLTVPGTGSSGSGASSLAASGASVVVALVVAVLSLLGGALVLRRRA